MILFACAQCGMKFSLKDEFAGRSTSCPTCKNPLIVPRPDLTQAFTPTDTLGGPASSLDQSESPAAVTLAPAVANAERDVKDILAKRRANSGRYTIDKEIARGGMGAVLRAIDCDIRREVAVKYLLDPNDPHKNARFIEEAQITGQLEHPNIVPIHELGIDAQKRLFFAMKMVHGRSLAQVLKENWALPRLLGILVNVCHALAYAHSRNVIHRDLKPANIMIGDFGEVYVMDWGLAKIVTPNQPIIALPSSREESAPAASSKIETSRDTETDLTSEGAIVGTPVYMSPEQARGEIHSLDARSDIYALGALLYEVLTRKAPVERDGGHLAILSRVTSGAIVPPAKRTPERAGVIPSELSAIAMKALALDPFKRYASVEAMRRDLELYLDGRSVSAKEDSKVEVVVKFARRNRGFTAATLGAAALLFVVLIAAFWINNAARVHAVAQQKKAEAAYTSYQKEQGAKEEAIRRSLPALVRAGKQLANEGDLAAAKAQLDLALAYDPLHLDARLLKAQLLVSQKDWKTARHELDAYLRGRPRDLDAVALKHTAEPGKEKEPAVLFEVAGILQRQQLFGLSRQLLREVESHVDSRKRLLAVYHKQLEANWPTSSRLLTVLPNGQISFYARNEKQIADLGPLRGMMIHHLNLGMLPITSLEPLRAMPLLFLDLDNCKGITDLSPLKGMPLEYLMLNSTGVTHLSDLEGMPLTELQIHWLKVPDLEPLRGMKLKVLGLGNVFSIKSLEPLRGMPLEKIELQNCNGISDLSPLRGMPFKDLNIQGCVRVSDLTPLAGMELEGLNLLRCEQIRDLAPLKGMPLKSLNLSGCNGVSSLEPLRGMPLQHLGCQCPQLTSLEPLRGMKLLTLDMCTLRGVTDLEPLTDMNIEDLVFTPAHVTRGMEMLREMKSLKSIGINPSTKFAPPEFWRRYDAKEFHK